METSNTRYDSKETMNSPILSLENVGKNFDGFRALDSVSFNIAKGEIFSLIGPNGSGKTTLVNVVTGALRVTEGSILFNGEDITNKKGHEINRMGVARTFQHIRLFKGMTVLENLGLVLARGGRGSKKIEEVLDLLKLSEKRHFLVGQLSHGDQRRLELARILVTDAILLILDEPTSGLSRAEVSEFSSHINNINASGRTILLVAHDMPLVMSISKKVAVLNFGKLITEGKPSDVQQHPEVVEAYLGKRSR